jgi:cation:H+ antiporter
MFEWSLPVWGDAAVFGAAAAAIGVAGTKSARYADQIADRTGLGEAITGMVLLGLITALPGLVASVVAALKGYPNLAIANAMGGIAIQSGALAFADVVYQKANLEHAAASIVNVMQTVILVLLLALTLAAFPSPNLTLGHVHPMTVILVLAAGAGWWLVLRTSEEPMWSPRRTAETVEDVPDPVNIALSLRKLAVQLLAAATITILGGAVVAEAAENLVTKTAIPEIVVGGLFMAVATSLPELVTSIAAVRRGALTLAVSNIVGGNFFDVLFVAAADVAYVHGSLYHGRGVGNHEMLLTALTVLMNLVLLLGLIYRQKHGPANIGFESITMLILYISGFLVLALAM